MDEADARGLVCPDTFQHVNVRMGCKQMLPLRNSCLPPCKPNPRNAGRKPDHNRKGSVSETYSDRVHCFEAFGLEHAA